MILKMNRKSKGKRGVIEYLLNEREQEGTAITLRGNPRVTQALIQNIERKHKYLSGGLMFAKDECINDNQKKEIMDAFEEVLFAGLASNQYNVLWVEHKDKERIELNFVVPRIVLDKGIDLDLYSHRRDLPLFDMWKNGINAKYGLADPNDPRRARTMSERTKVARGSGTIVANRKNLDETLHLLVQKGQIKSRVQMIELLQKSGYKITRQNEESISIKHEDIGKKALRLKGGIYSGNFTSIRGIKSLSEERERRIREYDNKVAREKTRGDRSTYQRYLQTRIDRHKKRYLRPEPTHKKKSQDTERRDTNDMVRKTHAEDKEDVNYDRIRELIEENRRRRAEGLKRAKKRKADLLRRIEEFNLRIQEQLRTAEQKLHADLTTSRRDVEANINVNAKRIDEKIKYADEEHRSYASTVQELLGRINGRIMVITKSIKGVVNEIKKLKLFKQAKEKVSIERPTIKLTPWS